MKVSLWFGVILSIAQTDIYASGIPIEHASHVTSETTSCGDPEWHKWGPSCLDVTSSYVWSRWPDASPYSASPSKFTRSTSKAPESATALSTSAIDIDAVASSSSETSNLSDTLRAPTASSSTTSTREQVSSHATATYTATGSDRSIYPDVTGTLYNSTDVQDIWVSSTRLSSVTPRQSSIVTSYMNSNPVSASTLDSTTTITITGTRTVTIWPSASFLNSTDFHLSTATSAASLVSTTSNTGSKTIVDATLTSSHSTAMSTGQQPTSQESYLPSSLLTLCSEQPCTSTLHSGTTTVDAVSSVSSLNKTLPSISATSVHTPSPGLTNQPSRSALSSTSTSLTTTTRITQTISRTLTLTATSVPTTLVTSRSASVPASASASSGVATQTSRFITSFTGVAPTVCKGSLTYITAIETFIQTQTICIDINAARTACPSHLTTSPPLSTSTSTPTSSNHTTVDALSTVSTSSIPSLNLTTHISTSIPSSLLATSRTSTSLAVSNSFTSSGTPLTTTTFPTLSTTLLPSSASLTPSLHATSTSSLPVLTPTIVGPTSASASAPNTYGIYSTDVKNLI